MVGTISRSTAGKRLKKNLDLHDRISQLPDEVIASILSYLTLKEAAATSVLSSHWVHLWKFTPRLNFDARKALMRVAKANRSDEEENAKYVEWVNQILFSHKCSTLEEFRVCFDLNDAYRNNIDNWLKFVLSTKVQKLELNFFHLGLYIRDFSRCYLFPFECHAKSCNAPPMLTSGGVYAPFTFGCSESLRELSLSSVNVTGDVILQFLSNCPNLERLDVVASGVLTKLEVDSPFPNLKYLDIRHCYKLDFVKICNTNLVSVKCSSEIRGRCVLLNNPLLVEVWLGSANLVAAFSPKPSSFLSQLEFLRVYSDHTNKNMAIRRSPRLPRLKHLEVRFVVRDYGSLLGFSPLVEEAPCLQKFVMEITDFGLKDDEERSIQEPISRPHYQLKTVELKGYTSTKKHLEVVIYFLRNAINLKELVIDPRSPVSFAFPFYLWEEYLERDEASRKLAKQQMEEISHLAPHVKISIL